LRFVIKVMAGRELRCTCLPCTNDQRFFPEDTADTARFSLSAGKESIEGISEQGRERKGVVLNPETPCKLFCRSHRFFTIAGDPLINGNSHKPDIFPWDEETM
jgi:hypothetical protein